MAEEISRSRALVPYRAKPQIDMKKVVADHGIRVLARDASGAFTGFTEIHERLQVLLDRVRSLDLSIEVGRHAQMPPETFQRILGFCIGQARALGDQLKSFTVEKDRGKLVVAPRTWIADERAQQELLELRLGQIAIGSLDEALANGTTKEEAEQRVASILMDQFRVSSVKVYDVAADGCVKVSHAYARNASGSGAQHTKEVASHFGNWVPPEGYIGETMDDIVLEGMPYVLVVDPKHDQRCRKQAADGTTVVFESKPFALIGEKIGGKVARVYKVDWESSDDLLQYGAITFSNLFSRLAVFKRAKTAEEESSFLDKVSQIVASESNINKALELISGHLAYFFSRFGEYSADSITIMLYDPSIKALSAKVVWTPEGVRKVEYYVNASDPGIAADLFYSQKGTTFIPDISQHKGGRPIKWRKEGKGSLIGTVVKGDSGRLGIIMVSSLRESAFSQESRRVLERVSERVGPAFERIIRHMGELSLDSKFGSEQFGRLQVYNPQYLQAQLEYGVRAAEKEGTPLSVIYIDIDDFKALNETSVHADVDYVLAEILRRIISNVRDGKVCKHGGEEVAIPVNLPIAAARELAERLRESVSEKDIIVRIPYSDRRDAARMLSKIREQGVRWKDHGIKDAKVEMGRDGVPMLVMTVRKTVSIGVAEYKAGDTADTLLNRADLAMQHSKRMGKNRVTVEGISEGV